MIFVESNDKAAKLLRENLGALLFSPALNSSKRMRTGRALEKLAKRRVLADFIFLDPPYESTDEHIGDTRVPRCVTPDRASGHGDR